MIFEVEGDLLLSRAEVLAHGVAPNDNFQSEPAHTLRERWPLMYKEFRRHCHDAHPKAGDVWLWKGPDGLSIATLMTQEDCYGHGKKPGRATLAHVNHSLRGLRKLIQKRRFKSVSMPRLATGAGGLDWNDVAAVVRDQLGPLGIPIYIYSTFKRGVEAPEPGITAEASG